MAKVKVNVKTGCWIHSGSPSQLYPTVYVDGKQVLAHRAMYEIDIGPVPEGLVLDHVADRGCVSKRCCNPAHLEPVTLAENFKRGRDNSPNCASPGHCKAGHAYTPETTYVHKGVRLCRLCRNKRNASYRAQKRKEKASA